MWDIKLNDYDTKSELPVHMVLGISHYTKIKKPDRARIGLPGEPIAEWTKQGCYMEFLKYKINRMIMVSKNSGNNLSVVLGGISKPS